MDLDQKERIKEAVYAYSKKQTAPKRKNSKPEEAIVHEHMMFYKRNKFFMKNYESKAKNINGVWRTSGLSDGTPDLMGVCPNGYFHANEIKAPGRRSKLRPNQREFLMRVILNNGFAICSDSVEHTESVYQKWIKEKELKKRRDLLIQDLPSKVSKEPIGDESD